VVASAPVPGASLNAGPAAPQALVYPMLTANTNTVGMWHKYCSFMVSHSFLREQIFFEVEI